MSHLIAKKAPEFTAPAVMADNTIQAEFSITALRGNYTILLFYPQDFSFVCPTEILTFDRNFNELKQRKAHLIGISVDSIETHLAWKETPVEQGGIGPVQFPLVSDIDKNISREYGVLQDNQTSLRALFLIDRDGIIRHAIFNDDSLGRNVSEAIRMLDALKHFDQRGRMCPANWENGKESIEPSKQSVVDYLSKFAKKSQ